MMYSEWIENTGARDNEANRKTWERIERIYMEDESFTKEDAYTWGKALMNNEPSEEEKAFRAKIESEIKELQEALKAAKEQKAWHEEQKAWYNKEDEDFHYYKYKAEADGREIKRIKAENQAKKWIIA